jgi:putative ABC transport system permease protein
VRTAFDLGARPDEPTPVVLTPAFLRRYGDTVGLGTASHMVRLVDTPDALGRFTDALERAYAGTTQPGLDVTHSERLQADSISVITAALVALALVVAIPGLVWIATGAARQQRLAAGDLDVLRVLGSTRAERHMLVVGTVAPALLAGAMLAPVVATVLSPLFPVGLARRFDPAPGLHADAAVLVAGSLLLLLTLGVAAALSGARLVDRAARRETGQLQVPGLVDRATRWLGPAPVTGVRFALSAPRSVSVAVRGALVGAVVGVLGLVGVAVVGTSLDRLVDTPARWGTTWDVAVATGALDRERVLDDRDIGAAAVGRFDEQVKLDGREATAMTLDPVKGDLAPTVIKGRQPRGDDEVAVGRETLDDLGVSIGASVDVTGRSATRGRFRVVGVVLFPTIDFSAPVADGAAFTLGGGNRLKLGDPHRDDAGFERLLIRWAPGVDHDAALERLGDGVTQAVPPIAPPEVNGLRDVRLVPAAAAAGLVVLGVISTGHALSVTVRRRRVELGVLSALGFTARQRRLVVTAQATTVACVALVLGIPLGIVSGRLLWSTIADAMGVATDPALPLGLIATGAAAVVVVLNLLGAIPARSAGRLPVAEALRSE